MRALVGAAAASNPSSYHSRSARNLFANRRGGFVPYGFIGWQRCR
jgi:hypothetical protein